MPIETGTANKRRELGWIQSREQSVLHYLTSEVSKVSRAANEIVLFTEPAHFTAEISLPTGWECPSGELLATNGSLRRVRVDGEGQLIIRLQRLG